MTSRKNRMEEQPITPTLVEEHNLTAAEYERIVATLGRTPTLTELGIFSVMWSEHCSYKSSRVHLRRLPTRGPCVIQGPGENAGVVDIGEGEAAVFKIESHNHPSFIEPYQGAATGVGGTIREHFTSGARPIARRLAPVRPALDAKKPLPARRRRPGLPATATASARIPTVGEAYFDDSYSSSTPGQRALPRRRLPRPDLLRQAEGGQPGHSMRRPDRQHGIHGATIPAEFDENLAGARPTVQCRPFQESCSSRRAPGVQDRRRWASRTHAAGRSVHREMGARGGAGVRICSTASCSARRMTSTRSTMPRESRGAMLMTAAQRAAR